LLYGKSLNEARKKEEKRSRLGNQSQSLPLQGGSTVNLEKALRNIWSKEKFRLAVTGGKKGSNPGWSELSNFAGGRGGIVAAYLDGRASPCLPRQDSRACMSSAGRGGLRLSAVRHTQEVRTKTPGRQLVCSEYGKGRDPCASL